MMNKKQVENWYGYLSESSKKCSKKTINEISNTTLNKFKFERAMDKASKSPSSLPLEHLFKGKLNNGQQKLAENKIWKLSNKNWERIK